MVPPRLLCARARPVGRASLSSGVPAAGSLKRKHGIVAVAVFIPVRMRARSYRTHPLPTSELGMNGAERFAFSCRESRNA
jgi:hypothetical protein